MRASRDESAPKPRPPDWAQLLIDAVNKPGVISTAYSRFWNYSTGNQLLAMFQCLMRGLPPGPIHTFHGWRLVGRHVKKGEKAITLCMPVTVKRKPDRERTKGIADSPIADSAEHEPSASEPPATPGAGDRAVTVFTYKPHWFVLAQTEGTDYVPPDLPEWSEGRALLALNVERVPFSHPNGNVQGFAHGRKVAVSPIAVMPHKTLFHELAHVVLGHTDLLANLDDHDATPVNLREVEAECVALICGESLGLSGGDFCRGYIQHWLGKELIPDRSAQRIFKAADAILKAGHPPKAPPAAPSASSPL